MTPQLQLIDVSVRLPDSDRPVLSGVSIEIDEGEFVLVSGPTGAGKSTLLGVLSGLVPRFSGGELSGRLVIDGVDLTKAPPRERAGIIGYVGQDPAAGFVADTVEEELAYGMEQLGLDPATMRRRVEETLDLLGISELRDRDLRSLSGGQQQRVAIGAVLTMHPKVLVLDEPTSALDPTAAEDVLATLARLVSDLATTVVIAEHRLERVLPFADRVIVVTGDGRAQISETAAAMSTAPLVPPLIELGRRLNLDPLPLTVREARRRIRRDHPALFHSPATTPAAPDHGRPGKRARRTGADAESIGATGGVQDAALTVRRLAVERGGVAVLTGVDLELARGSVTALMGRNGAGKSTLLWALQGTQSRSKGHVEVVTLGGTTDPATLKAAGRRDHVALLPQTASDLLYLETVADECAAAGPNTRRLLDELAPGIPDDRHPRDLSEGQKLVLALAIVLASTPPVILLDEPTRGLDYGAKAALTQILKRLAAAGHAILVATHDVEFVAQVAERTAVLAQGEIVSTGPTAQVVAQTPSFAPQVMKVLGPTWLNLEELSR